MFSKAFLVSFFLVCALAASAGAGKSDPPGFYVWQRAWGPEVEAAVGNCAGRKLFVLAAELGPGKGGSVEVFRSNAPPEYWRRDSVTAVFRVHDGLLQNARLDRLSAEVRRVGCARVQIDLDAPESQLGKYREWLEKFKGGHPGVSFSITALPCHLSRPDFAGLAALCDYYVLQLHGVEPPGGGAPGEYWLMSRAVTMKALDAARRLGRPFAVALPTYSYQLNHDRATGRFLFLNAEAAPPESPGRIRVLTKIDFSLLHDILERVRDVPVIWFRLPVSGDRLNLDMATVRRLEAGEIPVPKVALSLRREKGGRLGLYVRPEAMVALEPFEVRLSWPEPNGEFECFNGTENISETRTYGVLPTRLRVPMTGCGAEVKAAEFYVGFEPTKMEVVSQ